MVVPAECRIHNHRRRLCAEGICSSAQTAIRAVWVPAFTGTTRGQDFRSILLTTKKPGLSDRAFEYWICEAALGRFVRDRGIVAIAIRIGFAVRFDFGLRLGAAAWALGELAFDF